MRPDTPKPFRNPVRAWVKGAAGLMALGAVVFPLAMIAAAPWQPMTRPEISAHVRALHHYGAVRVPHDLAGADHPAAHLMAPVAGGAVLDGGQSARYRMALQSVLAQHQTMFRLLDNNLTFATDLGPASPNNCGGFGIAGRHDWHAQSAASNFAEIEQSLAMLRTAGALGRIRHANRAYKNLTDLMVHLAPAVSSVMLTQNPDLMIGADPARAANFETFRRAMTKAGFADIGSVDHTAALARALTAFDALVWDVQSVITAHLTPLEQRLAGRWLAPQSVSPRL